MKKNRIVAWILIILLVGGVVIPTLMQFGIGMAGAIYAEGADLKVSMSNNYFPKNGESTDLTFNIKNTSATKNYEKIRLRVVDTDLRSSIVLTESESFDLKTGESTSIKIPLNTVDMQTNEDYKLSIRLIAREWKEGTESEGDYYYYKNVEFTGSSSGDKGLGVYTYRVYDTVSPDPNGPSGEPQKPEKQYIPNVKLSIVIPQNGLEAGHVNVVNIKAKNQGNSILSDVKLAIGGLPEGVTLSNQTVKQSVDSMRISDEKKAEYRLFIKDTVKGGNYPITISAEGRLPNNSGFSTEETVYLNIKGTETEKQKGNLVIRNVKVPANAKAGADFDLSFEVANIGNGEAKNIKVSAEATEGIVNKTRGIFVEESISSGTSKKYTVTFFSNTKTEPKNYPIKINVEPLSVKEGEEGIVANSQYAGIYIFGGGEKKEEGEKNEGVKNPQIMIENYDFGGIDVKAGEEFVLGLTLVNTSQKALRNIKVSLSADEGTFVPVNTSNSFFIDSMSPKQRVKKQIRFSTKPSAAQQTFGLSVDMAYEDVKGNALSAKDMISVPVVQKTKLNIGEVNIAKEGVFVGQLTPASVTFYNVGKTVLSNLIIRAEGDFELEDKNGYFVGNMETGKSDSYDFNFIPMELGEAKGRIVFSYEDISGAPQTITKEFVINAMEMPVMEEDVDLPPEEPDNRHLKIGGGIAVVLLLLLAGIAAKKQYNKKREEELTIDE